jgi:hypothetical protein
MNNSLLFGLTDRSAPPHLKPMKLSRYLEILSELQDAPEPRLHSILELVEADSNTTFRALHSSWLHPALVLTRSLVTQLRHHVI